MIPANFWGVDVIIDILYLHSKGRNYIIYVIFIKPDLNIIRMGRMILSLRISLVRLRNNKKGKNIRMSYEFAPMDLDPDFIDDIYEEAINDKGYLSKPVEVLRPGVVQKRSGVIEISVRKIIQYSEYIDYMFGQIRAFHDPSKKTMSFKEGFIDYMNGYWTEEPDTIMKFYALGIANDSIYPFVLSPNGIIVTGKDNGVIPTLNTDDPGFDEWFEKVYKKQYKPRFSM